MLKWLKRIGLAVLALVAIFVAVGLFLPSAYSVERSVVIEADAERVHGLVGELRNWPEWQPWTDLDPTIRTTYGEKTTGVGAHQTWTGSSGNGELTFTRCDASGVAYELSFDEGKYRSTGSILYEPQGDATRVVWSMKGDSGMNIIGRYFGLMMDRMVGPAFQVGLDKLKAEAEKAPAAPEGEAPADEEAGETPAEAAQEPPAA